MTAASAALRDRIFVGDSEMARRMHALDWSTTDFGAPESWPDHLRLAVSLCLTSRFPIIVWWGLQLSVLYNDAYIPRLGSVKHPRVLGRPGREVWGEIWGAIGPMLESVYATGEATWSEDLLMFFDRGLPREEVYVTFSFAPLLSPDANTVDGIFCPATETTEKVIGARRLETLRRLGIRPAEARTVVAACDEAVAALGSNRHDVPFAAIYIADTDGNTATLCASMSSPDEHLLPRDVSISDGDSAAPWPLTTVLRTRDAVDCTMLPERGIRLRSGPWPENIETALVVPIRAATDDKLAGILVAGVSSRRPLDADYRTFFHLIAGHIGTAITDAQAHEAERKRADALAEIDRAKTVFFSNVSHEFRTPLTLMLGPIEDMLSRADGSVTIERGELELVHRSSLRLLRLVNTLLDFSRIEAGRMQAVYESVDLPRLTVELASMFRAAIEKAGVRLTVDCPPLAGPVYVDRSMWEKIVLNLLSNAFKFTFEGEISVALRRVGQRVELEIADTGTGIAEHELTRIFERFHRIEGARGRTFEGTGIGLALVQELAKLHGGAVRAESVSGSGSRFTVSIPLGQAHLPAPHVGPQQQSTATDPVAYIEEALRWLPDDETTPIIADEPPATGAPPRILVADDNADLREYVQRLLSPMYDVQLAGDGEAALAAARRNPPDAVLADVMMPRLDGFGLLAVLRSDPRTRRVPVIMLSARVGEEARLDGLAAGASDYLVKPFGARALLGRVNAALATASASRTAVDREKSMRRSAEDAEARTREELAVELSAMNRLHVLSTRLISETKLQPLLEEILNASIALLRADFGNIQLYDKDTGALKIVAHRGFQQDFLDYFNSVHEGMAACGVALQRDERVIVEDVLTDPAFEPHLKIVAAAGYRAVQSTPLSGSGGQALGMISTHFREPHRPSHHELRFMDLYASLAVELIERKRAEEALRASEERFRRYFELGLVGMALTSPAKGILDVNDEFCRIIGYERGELLQMTWAEMTHPDDLAADVVQFEQVLAGEIDGYSLDKRFIRKDGAVVHSIMAARCGRHPDGSVNYFVGLVQDMTERKAAEQALADAQDQLARVMRVTTMGELAASIAHEVNQPLAAIVAHGEAGVHWLARDPPDLAEVQTALERIVRDANRAGDVITRIRTFLKRQPTQRVDIDVREVIADVLAMLHGQLRTTGVSVVHEQSAVQPSVHADRVQLQQVILNLVMNAIDAMRIVTERANVVTIEVTKHDEDMVRISVRDAGVGIPPAQRGRVFDAFHTSKPDGLGMGLAISRSIVEAHGGRLWMTPNDGPGVTFQFALPVSP